MGKAIRDCWRAVVDQRDDRSYRASAPRQAFSEGCKSLLPAALFAAGDDNGHRLNLGDSRGCVRPGRLHDWEGAGFGQHVYQIGRRDLCDDDHRTQYRHHNYAACTHKPRSA